MKRSLTFQIGFSVLIAIIIVPALFPFFWMLMSSFKTQVDIIHWPPKFIFKATLQNYRKVFGEQNFLLYLKNSSVVGILSVLFF